MEKDIKGFLEDAIGSVDEAYKKARNAGIDEAAAIFALRSIGFSWARLSLLAGGSEKLASIIDRNHHRARSFGIHQLRVWTSPQDWIMIMDNGADEYLIPRHQL